MEDDGYRLVEWEPDLSSQTGASQAGILLGSNEDIPAFRWVEKDSGRLVACSDPGDCAMLEQRHADGRGLLVDGGASRGNLLSGEADESILTVSRLDEEKRANPGYRAFLASGSNAARVLVLFFWEVGLEIVAAARQRRRDIVPRGHRGGVYPFLRATMTTLVRDLVVFGVLTDMIRGRPAVYATFASYDEVAHHSGLERPDTLEALRRLDERFGRVAAMRRHAPRPYEIVVLSDHGQTQGATFRQRHGYGLDELVERSPVARRGRGAARRRRAARDGRPRRARGGRAGARRRRPSATSATSRTARPSCWARGNLGLVYLMRAGHRMTLEEIDAAAPGAGRRRCARTSTSAGCSCARPSTARWCSGRAAACGWPTGTSRATIRWRRSGRRAAQHLRRTDGFSHCPDILVGSFYDPEAEEGCAFEELISFHGGLGGPQTRPFVLYPAAPAPRPPSRSSAPRPSTGCCAGWRRDLQRRESALVAGGLVEALDGVGDVLDAGADGEDVGGAR